MLTDDLTCLSSFGDPSRVDIWLIVQNGFIDWSENTFIQYCHIPIHYFLTVSFMIWPQ